LKVLCLDRNQLTELPKALGIWAPNLEELYVRHNIIRSIAKVYFPSTIRILHLSSNQLDNLDGLFRTGSTTSSSGGSNTDPTVAVDMVDDDSTSTKTTAATATTTQCPQLTRLFVNGNQLTNIPEGILSQHPKLERLVICHNTPLTSLPDEIWNHVGKKKKGVLNVEVEKENIVEQCNNKKCEVLWEPNPNLQMP
jgi:Leucine-rich repeat (LRR) protein